MSPLPAIEFASVVSSSQPMNASFFEDFFSKNAQPSNYIGAYTTELYNSLQGYTFTGKERDAETGYSYFGARYMDHDLLTSFISVDRYADKYPFVSPYVYGVWNPIRLTDPNGDTVVLSSGATEMHNRFYGINDEYTKLYDDLHSCKDKLFLIGGYNDTPDVTNNFEGGTIVEYFPQEGSAHDNFTGDIYSIQWGDARSEYGGDESHVFLEEMFHAKQILDYGNNDGTIEREVRAKEFAIRVNPYINMTCTDSYGNQGVPTQLGILSQGNYRESARFLKEGRTGIPIIDVRGNIGYATIPGAYSTFPWK